jgi:hypothetical protein
LEYKYGQGNNLTKGIKMLRSYELEEQAGEVEVLDAIIYGENMCPTGNIGLNKGSSRAVRNKTDITKRDGFCTYDTSFFDRQFIFTAKPDLTGSDIYDICEQLYSEHS